MPVKLSQTNPTFVLYFDRILINGWDGWKNEFNSDLLLRALPAQIDEKKHFVCNNFDIGIFFNLLFLF